MCAGLLVVGINESRRIYELSEAVTTSLPCDIHMYYGVNGTNS